MLFRAACILLLASIALPATAHFLLNLNVRIFHVEHRTNGLEAYVRMPMPYLVADKTGPSADSGLPKPAPYTTNRMEENRLVHYVDFTQIQKDATGLGEMLGDGIDLVTESGKLQATIKAVRVYPLGSEPGFARVGSTDVCG